MHGKGYLSMDVAKESEVADTEGSTATAATMTAGCTVGWWIYIIKTKIKII
jgi:hypothetical protein